MLTALHEPRFVDLAPAKLYATMLDEELILQRVDRVLAENPVEPTKAYLGTLELRAIEDCLSMTDEVSSVVAFCSLTKIRSNNTDYVNYM